MKALAELGEHYFKDEPAYKRTHVHRDRASN